MSSDNLPDSNLALCCECGNLRKVDGRAKQTAREFEFSENKAGWRMTSTMRCRVCGRSTTHALLRQTDDPKRDEAEPKDIDDDPDRVLDRVHDLVQDALHEVPPEDWTLAEAVAVLGLLTQIARDHGRTSR